MNLSKYLIGALVALFATGCFESNPQPSPEGDGGKTAHGDDATIGLPGVEAEKVYASAPDENGTMYAIGTAGAAEGADGCRASDPEEDSDNEGGGFADVDDDGSFVIVVPDIKVPMIILTFSYPDSEIEEVLEVIVPQLDSDEEGRVWAMSDFDGADNEDPNSAPPAEYDDWQAGVGGAGELMSIVNQGDGTALVTGSAFSVTPLAVVAVANISNTEKVVVNAGNVGSFSAEITAAPSDAISVFAVNPVDHAIASAPIILTVPAE